MKKFKPYLIALLLYSGLISVVFYPIFFNKQMLPNDFGLSYYQPFNHNYSKVESHNHYINDVFLQFAPYRYVTQQSHKKGNFDFWNPNKCGGIPQYSITYATNYEITNFIYLIFPFIISWHLQIILQCLISAIAMFTFMRYLKIDNRVAFLCGLAYSLNSMFVSYLLYFYIAGAFCWLPFILLFFERYIDSGKIKYFFMTSLFLGLSMLGGFIQSVSFIILFLILYALTKKYSDKSTTFKHIKIAFGIIILSFLLTAFLWIPQIQYILLDIIKGNSRFESSGITFNIFKRLILTLLTISFAFPELTGDFRGFDIRRILDAFPNDFHAYIGLALLLLFIYGIINYKRYNIRHWIIIAGVSLVLPLLTPFYNYVYDRFFILFITSGIIVGGIVLNDFIRIKMNESLSHRAYYEKNWFENRLWITLNGYKLTNFHVLIGLLINLTTIIIFIYFSKGKLKSKNFYWLITIITFIQLFRFVHFVTPFIDSTKYPFYPENKLIKYLQKNSGYERIAAIRVQGALSLLPENLGDIYNLQFIDGYEGILPHTFFDYCNPKDNNKLSDPVLLGLFNVKYLVTDSAFTFPENSVEKVFSYQNYVVYKNKLVKDRVELFTKIRYISSKKTCQLISNQSFSGDTLFLEESETRFYPKQVSSGNARITSYKNNIIKIAYFSIDSAYLKLADVYYPGWKAFIDGEETQIYKANDCMRAIIVPPGNHRVEFIFKPFVFKLGCIISLITLISIGICFIYMKNR